jgi:hypothetical protein
MVVQLKFQKIQFKIMVNFTLDKVFIQIELEKFYSTRAVKLIYV